MSRRLLILLLAGAIASGSSYGDVTSLPGSGWEVARYETLWTKSPFAVATPEAAQGSTQYSLWGIGKVDGVFYASLSEKQSNEHFLLASDKPVRGLTLVTVKRGSDPANSQAVVQKDGQSIVLKLEQVPVTVATPNPVQNGQPGNPTAQNMPANANGPTGPVTQMPGGLMPGNANGPGGPQTGGGYPAGPAQAAPAPPFAIRRPPVIHLPQHPPPGP